MKNFEMAQKTRDALVTACETRNFGTMISREDYEKFFDVTAATIEFTLNGWDGKSYDGETKKAHVVRCILGGNSEMKFVKVGKAIHAIIEDEMIVEKATGIAHPSAAWVIDIERR